MYETLKKYPWDKWFSRKRKFQLVKGLDFHCGSTGMIAQLRKQAAKRQVKVSIHCDVKGNLIVQIYHA